MDILDIMLKWMDTDGSHNLTNGYGWIWISSDFWAWIWMDMDLLNFLSVDMDGYGFYKTYPCQSLLPRIRVLHLLDQEHHYF